MTTGSEAKLAEFPAKNFFREIDDFSPRGLFI
jgi:hypothetical protein